MQHTCPEALGLNPSLAGTTSPTSLGNLKLIAPKVLILLLLEQPLRQVRVGPRGRRR